MAQEIKDAVRFEPDVSERYEEGFNFKIVLAAFFIGLIMIPGSIYLGLISGGGGAISGAAQWVTVILFVELAKRSFVPLKKQEIFIIYVIAGGVMAAGATLGAAALSLPGGPFSDLIWRQYLVQSPYARAMGLPAEIPAWAVPPVGSEAILRRTFLHRDWLIPIILIIVNSLLLWVNSLTLGYTMFRLTSDKENLPFPMAPVGSEGAMALAESSGKKETWRWRVFSVAAMIGIIYGAVYVVIPTTTGILMAQPFQIIPIPFFDLTAELGNILPAAMFGMMTDLNFILVGFILPFWVVAGIFSGSVLARLVGNPLLHRAGIITNWQPGMTAIPANVATTMDFWINAIIAGGIVVALIGLARTLMTIKRDRKVERVKKQIAENRGDYPLPIALGIWALATTTYVIICKVLVPEFSTIWFIVFGFVLTPLLTYTTARMFGLTGVATGISFPMVREATFIFSGYKGVGIWFAPVPYFNYGNMPQIFKQLELTRTKFTSYYKAQFVALLIMLLFSFIFWQIIWRMSPIPSASYPFIQRMWPMSAMFQSLWVSSTMEGGQTWMIEAIKLRYIIPSGIAGFAIYGVLLLFGAPLALFYGIIGGVGMMPHEAVPIFLGAILGRYYFAKKVGPMWRRYTPVILAGYACGMGLVGMLAIAVALIARTIFQIVF